MAKGGAGKSGGGFKAAMQRDIARDKAKGVKQGSAADNKKDAEIARRFGKSPAVAKRMR